MTREDGLWADAIDQLDRQKKASDGNWLNFLNRMFRERASEAGVDETPIPILRQANCSISTETWKADDLFDAATLHHTRSAPSSDRRPVFVRYQGKLLVIDGNNRVVKWARERVAAQCEIIILHHPPQ